MQEYIVELRATPDTDENEEASIKRHGGSTTPQTIYYRMCASSYEEAVKHAIETEQCFTHRKNRAFIVDVKGRSLTVDLVADVWLFGSREIVGK